MSLFELPNLSPHVYVGMPVFAHIASYVSTSAIELQPVALSWVAGGVRGAC